MVNEQLSLGEQEFVALVDLGHDPYQELREAARRLLSEYAIDEEAALDAILAFGSESGARRILRQRWWDGAVELREAEAEAA